MAGALGSKAVCWCVSLGRGLLVVGQWFPVPFRCGRLWSGCGFVVCWCVTSGAHAMVRAMAWCQGLSNCRPKRSYHYIVGLRVGLIPYVVVSARVIWSTVVSARCAWCHTVSVSVSQRLTVRHFRPWSTIGAPPVIVPPTPGATHVGR